MHCLHTISHVYVGCVVSVLCDWCEIVELRTEGGTSNDVNHQLKIPMNSKENQKSTKEILKSKKKKKNLSTQKRTWYATNRMYVQFTKHKHETLNSCVELIYYTKNWPHCNEGMNRNAKIKKTYVWPRMQHAISIVFLSHIVWIPYTEIVCILCSV